MNTHTPLGLPPLKSIAVLGGFLMLVVVGGGLIGASTAPGEWYAGLNKPPFNPPNWLFAPVWLLLYIAIAVSGWRTWERARNSTAMQVWWVQLALNWLWPSVFFTLHWLWPALLLILIIWALIAWFIVINLKQDRTSALLFVPYLAWISFATLLNASVAILN